MKIIALMIVILLITGCIEGKTSDVKENDVLANQTESGAVEDIEPTATAVQTSTPAQTPAQTSPSPEKVNNTVDESIVQIRDAIEEALEKSNSSRV